MEGAKMYKLPDGLAEGAQLIVGLIIAAGCALGVILFWILNAG